MLKYSHTRKNASGNGDVPAGVQRVIDLHTADKMDAAVFHDLRAFVRHYKFTTTTYSKAELVVKAANIIDAGVMPARLSRTWEQQLAFDGLTHVAVAGLLLRFTTGNLVFHIGLHD